jgi:hypothetical protein
MKWKLIGLLSLFGLAMGIATVFVIPSNVEPLFWLVIFVICAYAIAKQSSGKHFIHGLLLGLANSVWITASHILLFDRYLAGHAREAAMMSTMPMHDAPKLMMAITGPIVGFLSGLILGLFAFVAGKIVKPPQSNTTTSVP